MKTQNLKASAALLAMSVGLSQLAQAAPAAKVKVSMATAEKAVLKKYHGHLEGKTALENEDGAWQYAVTVRSGKTLREIMVNANSGKIGAVEVTTKATEAAEAKADAKAAMKKAAKR